MHDNRLSHTVLKLQRKELWEFFTMKKWAAFEEVNKFSVD